MKFDIHKYQNMLFITFRLNNVDIVKQHNSNMHL